MLPDTLTMATENAPAPAPAPAPSAPALAARFSSFHRTLQEETLAKVVKIDPDYWNRIREYHDQFERVQEARAGAGPQSASGAHLLRSLP